MMRSWWTGILSACLAASLGGCSDPSHKQALSDRLDGMANTIEVGRQHEAGRGDRLGKTLNLAAGEVNDDVGRISRAPAAINELLSDDVEHWQKRESYRQEVAQELLEGKPANIEHTVPHMLY